MTTARTHRLTSVAVFAVGLVLYVGTMVRCAGLELAHAAIDPVVVADHAPPASAWSPPAIVAPASPSRSFGGAIGSAADDAADATVTVWRAGWGAILVMAGFYAAGALAAYKRGYIVKRWPRLDVSRAWAALSVALGIVATLIQIGIAGDLDSDAIQKQLAFAFGLFAQGNMSAIVASGAAKREERTRATDGVGPT